MPHILKKLAMGVLFACTLAAVGASPVVASPDNGTYVQVQAIQYLSMSKKEDTLCQKAGVVRRKVIKQFGKQTPGRDICKYGLRGGKQPPLNLKERYLQTMQRMIAPPSQSSSTYSASTTTTQFSQLSAGIGSLPACASESGTNYSTGPANTNPSGATGRYQIIPSTAANYGCNLSTPAGQDTCAQIIYEHQGRSAWVGCGG